MKSTRKKSKLRVIHVSDTQYKHGIIIGMNYVIFTIECLWYHNWNIGTGAHTIPPTASAQNIPQVIPLSFRGVPSCFLLGLILLSCTRPFIPVAFTFGPAWCTVSVRCHPGPAISSRRLTSSPRPSLGYQSLYSTLRHDRCSGGETSSRWARVADLGPVLTRHLSLMVSFNPLPVKWSDWNVHLLEVVSR